MGNVRKVSKMNTATYAAGPNYEHQTLSNIMTQLGQVLADYRNGGADMDMVIRELEDIYDVGKVWIIK